MAIIEKFLVSSKMLTFKRQQQFRRDKSISTLFYKVH